MSINKHTHKKRLERTALKEAEIQTNPGSGLAEVFACFNTLSMLKWDVLWNICLVRHFINDGNYKACFIVSRRMILDSSTTSRWHSMQTSVVHHCFMHYIYIIFMEGAGLDCLSLKTDLLLQLWHLTINLWIFYNSHIKRIQHFLYCFLRSTENNNCMCMKMLNHNNSKCKKEAEQCTYNNRCWCQKLSTCRCHKLAAVSVANALPFITSVRPSSNFFVNVLC